MHSVVMLLTFKLQVLKHSNEPLLHVSNVHIHNVCMPCHHPCVFVCGQLLCSTCTGFTRYLLYMLTHILRKCSESAILRSWLCVFRCCACSEKVRARSRGDKKREEYVTLGVGLLLLTKKGKSAWLLVCSDTVTKKTLLSVLVSSKTPLQIALSLSPLPTPLWILARRIQTALFLTC